MFKPSIKSYLFSFITLLGILAAFLKFALAITAFTPANQPTGYVAQDEITNYNLKSNTETLFRPEYSKEYWSGNLYAYPISSSGTVNSAGELWAGGAATKIDAQNFDTARLIGTMKDDGTKIPFRFASLSATQQGYLTSNAIINYLRGDRSGEVQNGGTLRQRGSAMGDIIHSRPYYIADTTSPTIFVGANDGMLHAIDASTGSGTGGSERWAYVPSMLLAKMKNLSVDPYVHDYYVDGQINIATILSNTKRILVGGLGSGGKGLYALDITGSAGLTAGSESAVASKILWEITPTKVNYANPASTNAYINLGYTYGTPTIAKVSGGTDVVIIGNGYNNSASGDYQAYLYVINANTGQLISSIKAGTSGTAASPNGLSTPTAVDTDNNGTMWKFDLAAATATVLLTTSPAQPITVPPAVAMHPNGGYMVTFATGAMLATADTTDGATFYAYGVWTGATGSNMVTQTLTERSYTYAGNTSRVRAVTANAMNWASDKGWKVALPAGEKVVGEGGFIENQRYYFSTQNPTLSYTVPNTTSIIKGETWLMELDYLSGGNKNLPFLDMNGDLILNNSDRIVYTASDTLPPGAVVGGPILTPAGIPVGKFISYGVLSQPILVQLNTLNDTIFNQNPDVIIPVTTVERGVAGGHFDVDVFYPSTTTAGTSATARITVTTVGQTDPFPATLGAISVDGVVVVPALTISDITNGFSYNTNATTIKNKVTGGFTASVSGNVVTISAPAGTVYNGKTFSIVAGTSSPLNPGVPAMTAAHPTALITFSGTTANTNPGSIISADLLGPASVKLGSTIVLSGNLAIGKNKSASTTASTLAAAIGTGGTIKAYVGGNSITPTCAAASSSTVCLVDNSTYTNGSNVTVGSISLQGSLTYTKSASAGGTTGSAAGPGSGWTDFKPALSVTTFSGGTDGTLGDTCSNGTARCKYKTHTHEYDDIYDVTGVNFLDASDPNFDLSNGVPSTSTQFRVLAQNQYLNPAAKLHIGNASYLYNVNAGYIEMKNYQTSAGLDVTTLPIYTRANIGSLAINFPVDAFTPKDWWGGVNGLPADVRVGLMPTENDCVWQSFSATQDGNMFWPVNPPGSVTTTGNGTMGYSSSTNQTTATGVRHNGAIVLQIISTNTPNSSIELNVPNHPEYGWRVKAADYSKYVLTEYALYWHTKHLNICFGVNSTWTKTPAQDLRACGTSDTTTTKICATAKTPQGTDPHIGTLFSSGTVVSTTTTVVGNVTTTTITYADTTTATIVKTQNDDGTITIVTTTSSGTTTEIVANTSGTIKTGGDERGLQSRTGRISWRELIKQ